jgi:hypothetical protein
MVDAAPLHVDKISDAIKRKFNIKLKPTYVASVIYRTIKKGNLFRKEGSNTFGLLEWPSAHQEVSAAHATRIQ